MSKARLVITAVIVEKRPVGEVAREYGVARSWVYKLLAPARSKGDIHNCCSTPRGEIIGQIGRPLSPSIDCPNHAIRQEREGYGVFRL
jgi:hypothetical protein